MVPSSCASFTEGTAARLTAGAVLGGGVLVLAGKSSVPARTGKSRRARIRGIVSVVGQEAYNSQMDSDSRRDFLRKTTSGALAMTAASYARVAGANERIHLGLIGAGDRGNHVMSLFQNKPQ